MLISYVPASDAKGRLNATAIRRVIVGPASESAATPWFPRYTVGFGFLALLGIVALLGRIPLVVALGHLVMSLLTWVLYAWDKGAARDRQARIQESVLHTFALLCGWPGALIAQRQFRHKWRKADFMSTFWATVVISLGLLSWLLVSGHTAGLDPLLPFGKGL